MTPAEIKFRLDQKLIALAQGGRVPVIVNIHSIYVEAEGNEVSVGFDIVPGDEPLFFEFERPSIVNRDDLLDFSKWLAWSDCYASIH